MPEPLLPDPDELNSLVSRFIENRRRSSHRGMLLLSGEPQWSRLVAAELLKRLTFNRSIWIGLDSPPEIDSIPASKATTLLGQEIDVLVFDAFSGLDVDALGASSGAIRAGGVLLLLSPPLSEWPGFDDPEYARITVAGYESRDISGRFLSRFVHLLTDDATILQIEQDKPLPPLPAAQPIDTPPSVEDSDCLTADQHSAVQAVIKVVTGHRRRPAVLISDRGRGKSASMGIAAARLLQQGVLQILVTAPRLAAVEPLFQGACSLLPEAECSRDAIHLGEAQLRFVAPDELIHFPLPCDLLLVDEAAAIPSPMLERLLEHYPRIAFASTIHGYEGTGRGFAVRFRKILDQRRPQWRQIFLETPIRWATGDPLERFIFRALALDASPVPDDELQHIDPAEIVLETLDRDHLAANESDLSDLFGLLVLAHYRTTPFDLRQLLDGPNLTITVLRYQGRIVATALVAREGGFTPATAQAIWAGHRRPRGHLLAQSLSAHLGLETAACLLGARIMRIAVHPVLQLQGLGRRMVAAIRQQTEAEGLDYVGASFGATQELMHFWRAGGLLPVRVGIRRGASSGVHSIIVLHPTSTGGKKMFQQARTRFLNHFPLLLGDSLQEMEPSLAITLLQQKEEPSLPTLESQDWLDLIAFSFANRGFEITLPPITTLCLRFFANAEHSSLLSTDEQRLLMMKVLQRHDWQYLARAMEMPGRAAAEQAIKTAVGKLILEMGDLPIKERIEQLGFKTSEPQPASSKAKGGIVITPKTS
ncbi:tRNA(Met) cytidine acetyltransferase TmcA [endosymbiont of Lamellibrachia barhami]|uniref:tRNA(Met) cytidine acetyltransferase TmcA n=1 Tax=endosymbiont of Lamellibrachia barhami TaxID=205975 RepID=UPI0015AC2494|nr:GNAT family N-acetyltransferase [endosymbiont of Lamellibrachia barhami]